MDVPENLKEIIDEALHESLSPFFDGLSQADSQQAKGNEVVDDCDVSEAVKQWVKDKVENLFVGKELNEISCVGRTTPEQLREMKTL